MNQITENTVTEPAYVALDDARVPAIIAEFAKRNYIATYEFPGYFAVAGVAFAPAQQGGDFWTFDDAHDGCECYGEVQVSINNSTPEQVVEGFITALDEVSK